MTGCRRRSYITPLLGFGLGLLSLVVVSRHNQRLLPRETRGAIEQPIRSHLTNKGTIQNVHPNKSLDLTSQFLSGAKDTVKKVLNFGELMRNKDSADEDTSFQEPSPEEINQLKLENLCPEPYRLTEEFLKEFDKISHVSNWTIAQNKTLNRNIDQSAVNVSIVNEIINSKPRIVILTPISNSAINLQHYFKLLCSFSYPHDLISIVLGEDSSSDKSYELAHVHSRTFKQYFAKVEVVQFEEQMGPISPFGKHNEFFQLKRRGHMARARNQLLFHGLRDEDYVMWMDVDVKYVPRDIIQHLLSANTDIIVPSCMFQQPDGALQIYDRNSWRETPRSLEFLKRQRADYLKLEGYTQSMRELLPDLKGEGHLVSIDGVGGCVMMIKADCHRKGLVFPPFIFQHHIETEGLAKMAKSMGYGVFGYPMLYVCHW